MGRKSKKQQAIDLLKQLNPDDLQSVLDTFDVGSPENSYADIEPLFTRACPKCLSKAYIRRGKNNIGLTVFQCKDCGRKFNLLSETPLEKTRYSWTLWVTVLEYMLKHLSIRSIRRQLIHDKLVDDIDELTVSAMAHKLRNSFILMPEPKLNGVVQVDEKHFRESQKGVKDPLEVLDGGKTRRKPHHRYVPSLYGTMGPEFATVCCAVDSSGHSAAKVVTMGQMTLEDFEDFIEPRIGTVSFLCSDMNTVLSMPPFTKSLSTS